MIDLKANVEKAELDLKAAAEEEPLVLARVRQAFQALQQARTRLDTERFEMLLKPPRDPQRRAVAQAAGAQA